MPRNNVERFWTNSYGVVRDKKSYATASAKVDESGQNENIYNKIELDYGKSRSFISVEFSALDTIEQIYAQMKTFSTYVTNNVSRKYAYNNCLHEEIGLCGVNECLCVSFSLRV